MKRTILATLGAIAALAFVPSALAEDPPVVPFPAANSGDVFVIAQTTTTTGAITSWFAPGQTVVFRGYAVDGKTRRLLTPATTRYFNVILPNVGRVSMKYTPTSPLASGRYRWTAQWVVPATYPVGGVNFAVKVRTKHVNHQGTFTQIPVAASMLNISLTPPDPGTGPAGGSAPESGKATTPVHVDAVNSTRPKNAKPRPIGCVQTNVFKRGERLVPRAWGFDLTTNDVLTMDNVTEAHASLPGQPDAPLAWGSHGAVGNKVWFWSAGMDIPVDYPLGDIVLKVVFTLDSGKTAVAKYPITINPA
jgi:hypothetical protein